MRHFGGVFDQGALTLKIARELFNVTGEFRNSLPGALLVRFKRLTRRRQTMHGGAGFGFGFPMILSVSFAASPKGREAEVSGVRFALSAGVHFFVPIAMGTLTTVLGLAAVAWGASAIMFGGSWNARRQGRLRAKD